LLALPAACLGKREGLGRVVDEELGRELLAELALDARTQAGEEEPHAGTFAGRCAGLRGRGVGAEEDSLAVAGLGERGDRVEQAPVGGVVGARGAVERDERAGRGDLPVDALVGRAVEVDEDDVRGRDVLEGSLRRFVANRVSAVAGCGRTEGVGPISERMLR
jgi:hypothetical protein